MNAMSQLKTDFETEGMKWNKSEKEENEKREEKK